MSNLDDMRPMIIGGEAVPAISGEVIETTDPATGEVVGRFPRGRAEDVEAAVAAAEAAFPAWSALPPWERGAALQALARLVDEHAEELALLDVTENGSPIREMRKDAGAAIGSLQYFAGIALQLRGETIPSESGRLTYTTRQPYGVVGRIIPFNHPFMFAASKIAAPLVAGNTVVIKPSEHTSLSAIRLGELALDVLPPGVLNVVTGYGAEAGDALVVHPRVRRIAFTGAAPTGRLIQQRAASASVKSVSLELGGKNPMLVFPDADLALAAEGAVRGMNFTWQGQSCGSTSRLLVHDSIYDEFVAEIVRQVEALHQGLPSDEATQTGAIVNRQQYDKVLGYIEIARGEGARLVAGGAPPSGPGLENGLFIRPTVFADVAPDSRLAQEEIFGPVMAAIRFRDYDEALRIANGVEYGLTASIFTRDLILANRFARDVHAGFVWVNDSSRHFPGVPFGGVKDSGVGREEDIEEMYSYTETKTVNVRFE